jgi:hypothetical protein
MVIYPNLQSTIRPIPYSEDRRVPTPPDNDTMDSDSEEVYPDQVKEKFHSDPSFEQTGPSSKPHLITQGILKDLVRDLDLSENQAVILALRLKGRTLLQQDTKICFFRNRIE